LFHEVSRDDFLEQLMLFSWSFLWTTNSLFVNEEKLDSDEVQKLQEGEIVEQAAGFLCSLPLSILGFN